MIDFKTFLLSFIPLFVLSTFIGAVPLFISLTNDIEMPKRKRLITDFDADGADIAVIFLLGGKMIFKLSRHYGKRFFAWEAVFFFLFFRSSTWYFRRINQKSRIRPSESYRWGIPLIIGPAALTTILIIVDQYGYYQCDYFNSCKLNHRVAVLRNSSLLMRLWERVDPKHLPR